MTLKSPLAVRSAADLPGDGIDAQAFRQPGGLPGVGRCPAAGGQGGVIGHPLRPRRQEARGDGQGGGRRLAADHQYLADAFVAFIGDVDVSGAVQCHSRGYVQFGAGGRDPIAGIAGSSVYRPRW